jgi:hypothetical protein
MKKIIIALIVCMICITPFVAAESLASLMHSYGKAKAAFSNMKQELEDCRDADDDCSDIEEDILNPAVKYASNGIKIMLVYMEYAGAETGKAELKQALDDLQYVQSKEDFDAVIDSVKTAWTSIEGNIKGKAVSEMKEQVKDLVGKGKLIDQKLKCGIDDITTSSAELDAAYDTFSAEIEEADAKVTQAENLMEADNLASAMIAIKEAQKALTDSETALTTATNVLKAKGGSLCTEVIVEEEQTEPEETEEEEIEEEVEEVKDIDDLIDDYGLEDYYNEATDAIDELVEYIEEKQDQGYDTSDADEVLAQAEDYLANAEDLILNSEGSGALSKLLNAQQTAERGLNSEYYSLSSSSSTEGSSSYQAFISCMESAGYSYQKDACYEDYSISDDTKESISDCLDEAANEGERMDCYAEADEEAEEQIVGDEEELNDRIDAVEQQLEDIEDAVTDLYDALADSGEESYSDDYKDIDAMIDSLLRDVQSSKEGYEQDIEDIQQDIEDEDYDNADDVLDTVEDEVDEFEDDTNNEIEDIQDEINAL